MTPIKHRLRYALSKARGAVSATVLDRRHGIDTSRPVDLVTLGIAADGRIGYTPSGWRNLPSVLRHIPVGADDVFLDLGSGKGRIVLQAARRPFKRVIGVEFSTELNAIALENVEATRERLRCQNVELVEADIADYRVPDDVTIVYAYNPVRGDLFEIAMRALIASFERRPRPMHLLYRNPLEHDRLLASGSFHLHKSVAAWRPRRSWRQAGAINIYRIGEQPAPA